MPIRIVDANSNATLWRELTQEVLAGLAHRARLSLGVPHLWLRDRHLRDKLLEEAHAQGHPGWLGIPYSFWNDLPERFDLRLRPIGLLTRRALISRVAQDVGQKHGFGDARRGHAVTRGHMLDGIFSDLLPEGVMADEVAGALNGLDVDDFGARRNAWVVESYRRYLAELDAMGRTDPRSVPALIADAIGGGGLPDAIQGADELHVYGLLYDLRSRQRLVRALHEQDKVDVTIYSIDHAEDVDPFWAELGVETQRLEGDEPPPPKVQPAPTGSIEAAWVAAQVKGALVEAELEPHEICIVARSGRGDTSRMAEALEEAGVPVTVRSRRPLSEVGALKAFLHLFRGAAEEWSYTALRSVVMSPYFDTGVRTRTLDHLAGGARLSGLSTWTDAVEGLIRRFEEDERAIYGTGLFSDHLAADVEGLAAMADALSWMEESRSEKAWVEATLELLRVGPFHLRSRLCKTVGEHWEVVRFDQRGVTQFEALLREWLDIADDRGELAIGDWYRFLRRLLESSELTLSSPMEKGVQVLEVPDAALTPFKRVYVLHANHGEFPRDTRPFGVLTDDERRQLRRDGLPVLDRESDGRRERGLWRSVVAAEEVTVLYRTTAFDGTPLLASLMVPAHDPATELPRTRIPRWEPVTVGQALLGAAAGLRQAVAEGSKVAVPHPGRLRRAVLAAVAEEHRAGGGVVPDDHPGLRPNPWNGEIHDPDVLASLTDRFDDEYAWSASQLESYGACPFNFFVGRVLSLDERGEAEEETTPLTFGGVAHDVLEAFYRRLGPNPRPSLDDEASQLLDEVTAAVIAEREGRGAWLGDPVLWRNTKAQMLEVLRAYVAWELAHMVDKGEWPHDTEWSFGFDGDEPITLAGPDLKGTLRTLGLRGRIDRIDTVQTKDGLRHRVLDYKSSSIPKAGGYEDGSLLQAVLYLEAINQSGFQGLEGCYRALKKPGKPQNGAKVKYGSSKYSVALQHVFSIPPRVRQGLFEPVVAPSQDWPFFAPGVEITRSRARLPKGVSRFHE